MRSIALLVAVGALWSSIDDPFNGFPTAEQRAVIALPWHTQSALLTPPRSTGNLSGPITQNVFVLSNFDPGTSDTSLRRV